MYVEHVDVVITCVSGQDTHKPWQKSQKGGVPQRPTSTGTTKSGNQCTRYIRVLNQWNWEWHKDGHCQKKSTKSCSQKTRVPIVANPMCGKRQYFGAVLHDNDIR